jgi:hypothetical protein
MAGGFFQGRDAVFAIAAGTLIAVALNLWYKFVARREWSWAECDAPTASQ